jgi:hypothetical protein
MDIKFHREEDEESMSEVSLVEQTLELARTTRNVVLYLLHFVYTEEDKKERKSTGFIAPIIYEDIPDELK